MLKKYILPLWIISAVLLFLYSYTQVDLSLTLSRASFVKNIETAFQYIGWFNRPLSTYIYSGVVLLLFVSYFLVAQQVAKKKISRKIVWTIILSVTAILAFSYNAFSYDLFNYIFDAKIITHYHQNPYLFKALDFPGDPMLSFMRWTHRTYPYGPFWLALTVPFSFIGNQVFFLTFVLFKAAIAGSFLLSCYFIEKIGRLFKKEDSLIPLVLFALNPLVLIECLVSSHNDIVMMLFAIVGVYLLFQQRKVFSFVSILLSFLLKFATGILLLTHLLFLKNKNKEQFFLISTLLMIIPVAGAAYRTNFQPWYLLFVIPFAVFLYKKSYAMIPLFVMTFVSSIYYIPFLYTGNWDAPIPYILNGGVIIGIVLSVILVIFAKITKFRMV